MTETWTLDQYRKHQSQTGKSKYNAKITEVDGIKFPSLLEANYYSKLKVQQRVGEVLYFLMQVPFKLPGNITYRVDFQIFHLDGSVEYVDTKGYLTQVSANKIKQVEALYPIKINIVKKA